MFLWTINQIECFNCKQLNTWDYIGDTKDKKFKKFKCSGCGHIVQITKKVNCHLNEKNNIDIK